MRRNDLHSFNPVSKAWTDLSESIQGTPPDPRDSNGIASLGGGVYVFGGRGNAGETNFWNGRYSHEFCLVRRGAKAYEGGS